MLQSCAKVEIGLMHENNGSLNLKLVRSRKRVYKHVMRAGNLRDMADLAPCSHLPSLHKAIDSSYPSYQGLNATDADHHLKHALTYTFQDPFQMHPSPPIWVAV